ncbi:MAG: hydroxychlorobactene glucosyltransferase CruC [Candidatus Acidiferrum sp.]
MQLPWIKDFASATDENCPGIALIFAARDEEEKLPAALATLAALDYPRLEIIAVNDRSRDTTARILDEFAAAHSHFRVVHVAELPQGWLGKPHALEQGYQAIGDEDRADGWVLFTDADVRFKPDALRRAVSMARERQLEHLTLLGDVEMVGFWETALLTFFGMAFQLSTNPAQVSNGGSKSYLGVGAFQLLQRTAYEASGTHRRLAMEVIDDMMLGKIVKQSGFRSGVGVAQDFVTVRWHAGLGNLVRGVTKNFFASVGFNVGVVGASIAALLITHLLPFAGVIYGHGWVRILALVAVIIALTFHAGVDVVMKVSPLYALTLPLGAVLFCYMLLRSTVVTLRQGGIVWRDTFYPLDELKRGRV